MAKPRESDKDQRIYYQQLEAAGAPSWVLEKVGQGVHFYVWPENMLAVEVFCHLMGSLNTICRWDRVLILGVRQESIIPTLDLLGIKKKRRRTLYEDVKLVESGFVEESK